MSYLHCVAINIAVTSFCIIARIALWRMRSSTLVACGLATMAVVVLGAEGRQLCRTNFQRVGNPCFKTNMRESNKDKCGDYLALPLVKPDCSGWPEQLTVPKIYHAISGGDSPPLSVRYALLPSNSQLRAQCLDSLLLLGLDWLTLNVYFFSSPLLKFVVRAGGGSVGRDQASVGLHASIRSRFLSLCMHSMCMCSARCIEMGD